VNPTTNPESGRILVFNGGSSSIKFAVFTAADPPERLLAGALDRIGLPNSSLTIRDSHGTADSRPIDAPTQTHAAHVLLDFLQERIGFDALAAVGHRIVHGGPHYTAPERLTPEVLAELRRISPFDPEHLPAEIALVEAVAQRSPGLPQIACFDTAFHARMPRVARLLALPRRLEEAGVRRYGFHGISYSFLMDELEREAGAKAARGRVVLAHLGNGASMAAVKDGTSIETTMGFTPTAGLPMSTRSGDLDPGLIWYLARTENMTPEQFHDMVNRRSGLLGVSEISPDMRDLLAKQETDPRAAEAVDFFCYQARKWIGALAAVLGGLDTLVFSGGIGENAAEVRARICAGLQFLGIAIDDARNATHASLISFEKSPVAVRVIRTDEEVTIAGSVLRILNR
jgi:acetate kinase